MPQPSATVPGTQAVVMVVSGREGASRGNKSSRFALTEVVVHKGKRARPLYSPDPQSDRRIRDVENLLAEGGGSAQTMRAP